MTDWDDFDSEYYGSEEFWSAGDEDREYRNSHEEYLDDDDYPCDEYYEDEYDDACLDYQDDENF